MLNYLNYLKEHIDLPTQITVGLVLLFLFSQVIGEILELKGRVVPEILKIRKFFRRRNEERATTTQTLNEVRQLLLEVNTHYSEDNISKRDKWMSWVNNRADVYDKSIIEISKNLADVTEALRENTKMTEEMFIQSSRDRIIDFATKVGNEDTMVSREEFNRIFKVYDKYERFLKDRHLTNGEIDIAYRIIEDSYETHTRNGSFIEDIRGYEN